MSANNKPLQPPSIGDRFNLLTITDVNITPRGKVFVDCKCDCGDSVENVYFVNLRNNRRRSCGCLHNQAIYKNRHAPRREKRKPGGIALLKREPKSLQDLIVYNLANCASACCIAMERNKPGYVPRRTLKERMKSAKTLADLVNYKHD